MSELAYTPAHEWVGDDPESLPLPSGNVVLVKKPNILAMIGRGDIPNPLIGVVEKVYKDDEFTGLQKRAKEQGRTVHEQAEYESELDTDDDDGEDAAPDADDLEPEDGLKFIDLMVWATVVAPRISLDQPATPGGRLTEDGGLSLWAIKDEDKVFITEWATDQLAGAATFREEGAVGDPVLDGGEVRAETERSAGDPGAGEPVAPAVP